MFKHLKKLAYLIYRLSPNNGSNQKGFSTIPKGNVIELEGREETRICWPRRWARTAGVEDIVLTTR